MAPELQIQVLGDFRLLSDGQPSTSLNTPRLQAFLTYLILHREAPQSRQQLAFTFWPDSSESQARTNLRNLLYHFRRALPAADQYLRIDRQTIGWIPESPYTVDVGEFEEALKLATSQTDLVEERRTLQRAVDLYRGDLLPSCYEDWILPERERLRAAHVAALERLVQLAEEDRQYPLAIRHARRILRQDPLHEAAYRQLMRLHALNKDPAGALRTYHACASILERELGVEPSPETRQVYERLLDFEDQPRKEPLATRAPLVGREEEWRDLRRVWRKSAAGHPQLGLLTGEAGIGKTRLAEELTEWGTRQGIPVLSARCYAAEGRLAYAPIIDWLRTPALQESIANLDPIWLQEISRLLPDVLTRFPDLTPPTPLTENWQRQKLHEALARGIFSVPQPLLLVIDNLQWADAETLEWLHYLLRFDPRARFLTLGTVREEETAPDDPLGSLRLELRRQGLLSEIALNRLDEGDTGRLAAQALGRALDPDGSERLFRETEGNPLFVMELVRAGTPDFADLTPRLQAVIERRLSLLSPQARNLAGLAATIGRAFGFDVLAQASHFQEDQLVQSLDELWSRRVVHEQGLDAYDFSHERLREVAYHTQSAARRRLNHRRTASALIAIHQDDLDPISGQVATHYAAAGDTREAITYYQRAAETARRLYANQEAIDHYTRILELLERGPDAHTIDEDPKSLRALTHESLGNIQDAVGHHEDARRHYKVALDLTPEAAHLRRAHLEWKIGQCWHKGLQHEAALPHFRIAEATLEGVQDRSADWWQVWIGIQQARIWVHYRLADLDAMQSLVEKLEPLVKDHGSAAQRAEFFGFLVATNNLRNRFVVSEQDIDHARAQVEASLELGSELEVAKARFSLGFELLWFGDLENAEKHLECALQAFERFGYRFMASRCLTYLTTLYRLLDDEEKVRARNRENRRLVQEFDSPDYRGMTLAHEAWLAWRAREPDHAEALARAALEAWHSAPQYPLQWAALWPALASANERGDLQALAQYARAMLAENQQRQPAPIMNQLDAFVIKLEAGDEAAAQAHLKDALQLATDHGYL